MSIIRNHIRVLLLVSALPALLMAPTVASASSSQSFTEALFADVYVSPTFATDTTAYTLTIGASPKVLVNSAPHEIKWITAFYAVSGDPSEPFTATGGDPITGWTFSTKSNPAFIAGWEAKENRRLMPTQAQTFTFGEFETEGTSVWAGLHVAYVENDKVVTNWFKAQPPLSVQVTPTVPEPSSVFALLAGVSGAFFWKRK